MKVKIPIQVIELEANNFHLIIESIFTDGSKGKWAIDTGASKTVFDKNLEGKYTLSEDEPDEIQSAGLGEKLLETSVGILGDFTLGTLTIKEQKAALLDLSHINEHYTKATDMQICGLIGGDILMKLRAVIDYKKKTLILRK